MGGSAGTVGFWDRRCPSVLDLRAARADSPPGSQLVTLSTDRIVIQCKLRADSEVALIPTGTTSGRVTTEGTLHVLKVPATADTIPVG